MHSKLLYWTNEKGYEKTNIFGTTTSTFYYLGYIQSERGVTMDKGIGTVDKNDSAWEMTLSDLKGIGF